MWATERARYLRKGTWCEPEQAHLHHASEDTATCALARSRTGPAAVPTRERPVLCMLMADAILGGGGLDLYDRRLGRPTAALFVTARLGNGALTLAHAMIALSVAGDRHR